MRYYIENHTEPNTTVAEWKTAVKKSFGLPYYNDMYVSEKHQISDFVVFCYPAMAGICDSSYGSSSTSTKFSIGLGNILAPSFITLGPDLAHVWDFSLGTVDLSPWYTDGNGEKVPKAEIFATHIENQLRAEHSQPLRTHYSVLVDGGKYSGEEKGEILNSKGESLYYNSKTLINFTKPTLGLRTDGENLTIFEFYHSTPFKYR